MKKVYIGLAVTIALILTGVTITVFCQKTPQTAPTQATEPITEPKPVVTVSMLDADILFNMVNEERAKVGVKPLIRDARLDATAQERADDMVARNYFSHYDPITGEKMIDLQDAQCSQSENIAEAATRDRNKNAIEMTLNSQSHRLAMLNAKYAIIGLGIKDNYAVFHFCSQR
jgi:uncharacterized protein YkwD